MSGLVVATSALALGLMGSVHCAGMCGPLAVAGCAKTRGVDGALAYLGGRFVAYTTLGALVGHLGKHALCLLPVHTSNVIAVGLTALPIAARGGMLLWREPRGALVQLRPKPAASWWRSSRAALLATLAKVLPRRGLGLGLATGILPCGLLFGAFAVAAATASAGLGAVTMAAFALGSAPGLVVPLLGRGLAARWSRRIPPRVQGVLWLGLALLLGVRLWLGQSCHVAGM